MSDQALVNISPAEAKPVETIGLTPAENRLLCIAATAVILLSGSNAMEKVVNRGVDRVGAGYGALAELREFAGFEKGTQRYIRRSLDVGLQRRDAVRRWSRDPQEASEIRAQQMCYRRLESVRAALAAQPNSERLDGLLSPLVYLGAFDLASGRLPGFAPYRFLYERLIGAAVRPWLPGAFCAAAALPHLHPEARRRLLSSVSEAAATAAGWSSAEPSFIPEWVEKVEAAAA
jgi:hypothetical protein